MLHNYLMMALVTLLSLAIVCVGGILFVCVFNMVILCFDEFIRMCKRLRHKTRKHRAALDDCIVLSNDEYHKMLDDLIKYYKLVDITTQHDIEIDDLKEV